MPPTPLHQSERSIIRPKLFLNYYIIYGLKGVLSDSGGGLTKTMCCNLRSHVAKISAGPTAFSDLHISMFCFTYFKHFVYTSSFSVLLVYTLLFSFHHTVALSVLTISRGDPLNGVMGDRMSVQYSADTDELFMRKRGNGAGS